MDTLLLAAAGTSFFTFAVHTWIGGPRIAAPLLASNDIPEVPNMSIMVVGMA